MTDRQAILAKLVEILEADTDVQLNSVTEDLSLREGLGLDSVDLVGIIMRIEENYRIRLSHVELEQVATVKDLIDLVITKIQATTQDESSRQAA